MEKRKENRNLKVYSSTTGYKRKETPMIMLKGAWLQELGFDSDTPISVKCEDGKITITPREPVKVWNIGVRPHEEEMIFF